MWYVNKRQGQALTESSGLVSEIFFDQTLLCILLKAIHSTPQVQLSNHLFHSGIVFFLFLSITHIISPVEGIIRRTENKTRKSTKARKSNINPWCSWTLRKKMATSVTQSCGDFYLRARFSNFSGSNGFTSKSLMPLNAICFPLSYSKKYKLFFPPKWSKMWFACPWLTTSFLLQTLSCGSISTHVR